MLCRDAGDEILGLELPDAEWILRQCLRERIGHGMASRPTDFGMRTYPAFPRQRLGLVSEYWHFEAHLGNHHQSSLSSASNAFNASSRSISFVNTIAPSGTKTRLRNMLRHSLFARGL